jgi:hypothetical protein
MPTVISQDTTMAVMITPDHTCHEPGNPGITSATNIAITTPANGHHHQGTHSRSWNVSCRVVSRTSATPPGWHLLRCGLPCTP